MLKCLGDGLSDHGETSKKCPAGGGWAAGRVFGNPKERYCPERRWWWSQKF